MQVATFDASILRGILRGLPIGRPGVCGLKILTGDDRILTVVGWGLEVKLAGLGWRGLALAAGIGVLPAWLGLPDVVHDLTVTAAGEFSLSTPSPYFISVRGRTRTGEPKFVCRWGGTGDSSDEGEDENVCTGGMGGSFAAMRILTGDDGRCTRGCVDSCGELVCNGGTSCSVGLAFGLRGVFHCGLIFQSGSTPSFFARARVMRRGGDAMSSFLVAAEPRCGKVRELFLTREDSLTMEVLGGRKLGRPVISPATKCKQMPDHHASEAGFGYLTIRELLADPQLPIYRELSQQF